MLTIDDISYSVEGRLLLDGASARIPAGHKVGLIGRNGTGKTTLFRLIRGELALEGGAITLPQRARIGGVAQEVPANEVSLLDTVLAADTERAALMAEAEEAVDATRIAEVQTRLADIDDQRNADYGNVCVRTCEFPVLPSIHLPLSDSHTPSSQVPQWHTCQKARHPQLIYSRLCRARP